MLLVILKRFYMDGELLLYVPWVPLIIIPKWFSIFYISIATLYTKQNALLQNHS